MPQHLQCIYKPVYRTGARETPQNIISPQHDIKNTIKPLTKPIKHLQALHMPRLLAICSRYMNEPEVIELDAPSHALDGRQNRRNSHMYEVWNLYLQLLMKLITQL